VAKARDKKVSAARKPKRPREVRIDGRALRVGHERVPLLSGAMHYFRLAPDAWRPGLLSLKRMGLPIVETYTPWGVHEIAPGQFDFGETDPRRDLARFIDLAGELGLWVFIRPGPHINAEMTNFGLPERIIYDKSCQARSPRQNPVILPFPPQMFPVPSYASERFHEEAGRWYDAVGKIVAPRIYPDGPVVLLQVDNEASYYFRTGPFDQDYHPDAVAAYRRFLEARYDDARDAADAHRQPYESFDDIEPPSSFAAERPEELVRYLDWSEFREHLITDALVRMRARMAEAGLSGVPVIHNIALGEAGLPISIPGIDSAVDLVGLDYYHPAREHRTIKRRTLLLTGTVELPYAPEMGVGAPPWFTPLSHDDSVYCTLAAFAFGLRGLNLYMAVDRDRWYGSPIDARGEARVEAAAWREVFTRLTEVSFHELTRKAEVALVLPPEYRRLSRITHLFGGIASPSTLEALGGTPVDGCREDALGFAGPIQVLWWRMLAKMSDALTEAQIPYVWIDGDASLSRFDEVKLVVWPSYEFASMAHWERLTTLADAGKKVIYGPSMPELDERMRFHHFETPRNGERVLLDSTDDARALVQALDEELRFDRPFHVTPAPLETTVHEDAVGPRVLFVMNPDRVAREATIALPEPVRFLDLRTGERFEGDRELVVPIAGLTVRVFVIEAAPKEDDKPKKKPRARRKGR
jgi:beta-galactosidase